MGRGTFGQWKKYCFVCGKEFYIYVGTGRNGKSFSNKRPRHANTCSKDCSKLFNFRRVNNNAIDRGIEKLRAKRYG